MHFPLLAECCSGNGSIDFVIENKKNKMMFVRQWRPQSPVRRQRYTNRHKSHFRTVQKWFCFALSFIPLTTICFYTFFSPKENIQVFFWLQSSPGPSRIMVHWIPSLPFSSLSGTRITFNKLCSKPKTTPEKEEWKIPQKIVSEKNIKKLHSSTSCFENFFGSRFGAWKRNECLLWDCLLRFSRVLCLK